jgi:glycosyltransferase involved in cell wall biosynthesis
MAFQSQVKLLTTGKIKVLECIRQGQIGGGESHLLSLIENMDHSRFHPVVLSFTEGPMVERLQQMGVQTHVIYTEKPFDITKWQQVKKWMQEEQFDLVHAHGTRANSNIMWAARSLKIPVVYTIHGWSFHQDQHPLVRSIRIWGEKFLTARAAINISVSASNKASGRNYLKNFESVVINNGIDQKKFCPEKVNSQVRQELQIPANRSLVLFVARFTWQKQPLLLMEAFHQALKQVPDLHLLMVGDGELKQEALELARSLQLEDRITFQSFRQDVPALLAASDIFVLPSLWEGLPIGLLEAMAMGKAIIATEVDGTREVIRHNENGILIKTADRNALAEALVNMSKDKALQKRISEQARKTVQKDFNAEAMTRKIEKVYAGILQQYNNNNIRAKAYGI